MTAGTRESKFLILSAAYIIAMSIVWSVALSLSEHVMYGHMLAHIAGFVVSGAIIFIGLRSFNIGIPAFIRLVIVDRYIPILVAIPVILLIAYIILLGNVPLLDAIRANEYYAVAKIRTSISGSGFPTGYLPNLITRSIAPALVIYFIYTKRLTLAFFVFLTSASVGLLTITKGHVIFSSFPVILYCILTRRFRQAAAFIIAALLIIYAIMVVTNPPNGADCQSSAATLRTICSQATESEGDDAADSADLAQGLTRRAIVVPGQVVSEWFETFPDKIAFENGCGYRFFAPILGCEFKHNARLVYSTYFPDRAAQGIKGNKNAAHFMEEYANFGVPGLFLAGALAAATICLTTVIMGKVGVAAFISINIMFILLLTSTALHTTLLSGGWFMAAITSSVVLGSIDPFARKAKMSIHASRSGKSGTIKD